MSFKKIQLKDFDQGVHYLMKEVCCEGTFYSTVAFAEGVGFIMYDTANEDWFGINEWIEDNCKSNTNPKISFYCPEGLDCEL